MCSESKMKNKGKPVRFGKPSHPRTPSHPGTPPFRTPPPATDSRKLPRRHEPSPAFGDMLCRMPLEPIAEALFGEPVGRVSLYYELAIPPGPTFVDACVLYGEEGGTGFGVLGHDFFEDVFFPLIDAARPGSVPVRAMHLMGEYAAHHKQRGPWRERAVSVFSRLFGCTGAAVSLSLNNTSLKNKAYDTVCNLRRDDIIMHRDILPVVLSALTAAELANPLPQFAVSTMNLAHADHAAAFAGAVDAIARVRVRGGGSPVSSVILNECNVEMSNDSVGERAMRMSVRGCRALSILNVAANVTEPAKMEVPEWVLGVVGECGSNLTMLRIWVDARNGPHLRPTDGIAWDVWIPYLADTAPNLESLIVAAPHTEKGATRFLHALAVHAEVQGRGPVFSSLSTLSLHFGRVHSTYDAEGYRTLSPPPEHSLTPAVLPSLRTLKILGSQNPFAGLSISIFLNNLYRERVELAPPANPPAPIENIILCTDYNEHLISKHRRNRWAGLYKKLYVANTQSGFRSVAVMCDE
jgi:hypothetical protein